MTTMDNSRKCWKMIGGILVEKTAEEIKKDLANQIQNVYKFIANKSDLFDAFQPLENFPPRTINNNGLEESDIYAIDNYESGILLRDAVNTALSNLSLDR